MPNTGVSLVRKLLSRSVHDEIVHRVNFFFLPVKVLQAFLTALVVPYYKLESALLPFLERGAVKALRMIEPFPNKAKGS